MTAIYVHDVTRRDGMHAVGHQYTAGQVHEIAPALDNAGAAAIGVAHGDGLAGSCVDYGHRAATDAAWRSAAAEVVQNVKPTTPQPPGAGTTDDLRAAQDLGVTSVRVATHCTEGGIAIQHIAWACGHGMDVAGFLMLSHLNSPPGLAAQAKIMEHMGAPCVFVTDSCGRLTMSDVDERIQAYGSVLSSGTEIGIRPDENLALSVANKVTAVEHGAFRVAGSLAGQGAGAGNTQIEAFIAVAQLLGWDHGCDLSALQNAAEDFVQSLQTRPVHVDRETLPLGYAGVYSGFVLHAERDAARYGNDARAILLEAGLRGLVGGQEDMLVDVALDLVGAGEAVPA